MLIHKIMHLLHEGLNPAKVFGRKAGEKYLVDKMKKEFTLVKKPCGNSITSINNIVVHIVTQILARKIMRKCHADGVFTPVVSLAAQCVKGMQFNWSRNLCNEFLMNFTRSGMRSSPSTIRGCFSPSHWSHGRS